MNAAYYEVAIADEVRQVINARPGARNSVLNSAAYALASLGIPENNIRSELMRAAEGCGLVKDDGMNAVLATIASGMKAGYANPRKTHQWVNGFSSYRAQPSPSFKMSTNVIAKPRAPAPSQSQRAVQIPPRTQPDKNGKPRFVAAGEQGPPSGIDEIRRHAYRRDGSSVRIKVKYKTHGKSSWANWYRVLDGNTPGWQAGKPNGYIGAPYVAFGTNPFDPEARDDVLYWPEGEKDVDSINKLGELAFSFGGTGDGLTDDVETVATKYVSGRDVVIPADNDQGGREHAEKKAAFAHRCGAKSVKVIEFPDLPEHGDVSDWIAQGHTAEELRARADAAPLWSTPSPSATSDDEQAKRDNALIDDLANLSEVAYAKRRAQAAKQLGIGVGQLDKAVQRRRAELEADAPKPLYEHWNVEPWEQLVSGDALFRTLVARIRRHVVLTPEQATASALWVMFTWVHDVVVHSPILLVSSAEPNSGKSTLLGVINFLARHTLMGTSITGPVLFRSIKKWGPTFVIDEADKTLVNNDDLREVVNSGWTRGQGVPRCDPVTYEPHMYSTFAPKAIGMKGRKLPDTTLSRSIVIELKRKLETELVEDFYHTDDDGLATLRRQCLRWANDNADALVQTTPEMLPGFHNRTAANWKLLLAIAERIGARQDAHKAARAIENVKDAREASIGIQLLSDIRQAFEQNRTEELTTKRLIAILTDDPERPWAEYKDRRAITPKQLGAVLSGYGISSDTVHPPGEPHAKGYRLERFSDTFARYLAG